MDALGSLLSSQEARVALGYRLERLLRFYQENLFQSGSEKTQHFSSLVELFLRNIL